MKAADLVSFFSRKIAKSVPFNFSVIGNDGHPIRRFYSIEPTAVTDDALHAIVNFKHQTRYGEKRGTSRYCGEAEIPLQDGDTVESVLDMVIAKADFGEVSLKLEMVDTDTNRMANAYNRIQERLSSDGVRPPGP
jgi:hypothetical protein